jgi:hypothetical protein
MGSAPAETVVESSPKQPQSPKPSPRALKKTKSIETAIMVPVIE